MYILKRKARPCDPRGEAGQAGKKRRQAGQWVGGAGHWRMRCLGATGPPQKYSPFSHPIDKSLSTCSSITSTSQLGQIANKIYDNDADGLDNRKQIFNKFGFSHLTQRGPPKSRSFLCQSAVII